MAPPQDLLPKPGGPNRRLASLAEVCGVAGLIGLFAYFLTVSWRKWPDPLIDFGRELYLPWRLSHGAVLYRDVDDYYGPLSQYFDSALFTCFGPGLMHLAWANILIFMGILTMTYLLFRRAWGAGAAQVSLALFIAVFGFSQLDDHGNYNYICPYAHETTHGMFVCLALATVALRWVDKGTLAGSFLIGLLLGCALVLKVEFALAGTVLIAGAIVVKHRFGQPAGPRAFVLMACGAALPTAAFAFLFATVMPWGEALNAACRAWLNVATTTRFYAYPLQLGFLGLDRPGERLGEVLTGTLAAGLLIALVAASGWLAERTTRRWLLWLSVALAAAGMIWLSTREVSWLEAGRCLPGLLLVYLALCASSLFAVAKNDGQRSEQITRLLLALLAASLLVRMFLHPRIYHFGYCQAVLAAIMVPAILIGELPVRLNLGRKGATAMVIVTLALFLPGALRLCVQSGIILSYKTVPVGTGADRFYASRYDRTSELVDAVSAALRKGPRDQTLLVLPEGVMINYLARLPSPVAPIYFFAMATSDGREDQIVADLDRHPPDCVVIISRSLFEYGIMRYGDQTDEGRQIMAWVRNNYGVEAAKGGNPLDGYGMGAVVLTRTISEP